MAVTANGTPYVESSDLVANYPAVSLALAEHIDDLPAAILQVVRATDATQRTTTSTSFVDVTGMSVTITPQKATSNLIIVAIGYALANNPGGDSRVRFQITDSANTALSGAQSMGLGLSSGYTGLVNANLNIWGYVAAVNTTSRTYKLRFNVPGGTGYLNGNDNTSQMYAIEVSA
jgi:hypothetical protein